MSGIMNLQPGTRLKQYEILEAIGAGGMGEVYSAKDTNLDRKVAVKVLPQSMVDNPVSLARLEREAKAIAALSHPNVLAVYDFGSEDGSAFLVTELLEGSTLRERLADGPLPSRKATEIGRQIARGLAAAHDKSIVHRDLKPDNIYLTEDGRVKILDFGLATAGEGPEDSSESMATLTNITKPGTVLGTVDYMSPEQVRGQATDNRSDLFSFGSVLYEMVGGSRPFNRETHAETMTAILKEDPADLSSVADDLPPAFASIIRRCLEKQPGERFHSAHDLAFSLEALSGSAVSTGTAAALADVAGPRRGPGVRITALLVLMALLVGAAAAWFLRPVDEGPGIPNFTILSSRRGTVTNARFTGNEGSAVYSATWDGEPMQLFTATQGSKTSPPLDMESAALLSVSSAGELAVLLDRRYPVGFEVIGTLAVAQPGGAAPRRILEDVMCADWSPDGNNLAVAHEVGGIVRLEYPIGTVIYESPGWIIHMRVSPDGDRIVFAEGPGRGDNTSLIKVVHLDGTIEDLGRGGAWGILWGNDGETIWASHGPRLSRGRPGQDRETMMGFPASLGLLDMDSNGGFLMATGSIRRELFGRGPGQATEKNLGWLDWSTPSVISSDGKMVIFEEGNEFNHDGYAIFMRNSDGSAPQQLGFGSVFALSPDQRRVAVIKRQFQDEQELTLVPIGPGDDQVVPLEDLKILFNYGHWLKKTDDGRPEALVMCGRQDDGIPRLYHIPVDGSSPPRAISPADMPLAPQGHAASPDGGRVIVTPADGPVVAFDIDGKGPFSLAGVEPGDLVLGFAEDADHIYVQGATAIPSPIFKVNLETGTRELWLELAPTDAAGVFTVDRVRITPDGRSYIYSNRRAVSALTYVRGLQ